MSDEEEEEISLDQEEAEEWLKKWTAATFQEPTKPLGYVPGMRNHIYHASPGVSGSMFLHPTQADMEDALKAESAITYATTLGDAFHIAVLEPNRFDTRIGVEEYFQFSPNKSLRGKKVESARRADPDRPVITESIYEKALRMRDAAFAHRWCDANILRAQSERELSGFVWDPDNRCLRRIRTDIRPKFDNWIADLKSMGEGVEETDAWRTIVKRHYDAKAAYYADTDAMITGQPVRPLFYVVGLAGPLAENKSPKGGAYKCRVFEIFTSQTNEGLTMRADGQVKYKDMLPMFCDAVRNKFWEGYEHEGPVYLSPDRPFERLAMPDYKRQKVKDYQLHT